VVDMSRVWDAMAAGSELSRPAPAAGDELSDLVDWARANAADGDGRCSILLELLDGGSRAARGEAPPAVPSGRAGYRMFREVVGLARRLRTVEADRVHGSWIFLRLETSATWFTVERCYDGWPAWMPRSPFAGPSVRGLRREMDARAPEYRPPWAGLLTAA
jgi:hypothetical protein